MAMEPQVKMNKREFALYLAIGAGALIGMGALGFGYKLITQDKPAAEVAQEYNQDQIQTVDNGENDGTVLSVSDEEIDSDAQESEGENQDGVDSKINYPLHENISVTLFWVGEKASDANDNISNSPSAWDEKWKEHYGGVDSPKNRNGYFPAKFMPKENPFYFALPYNDFDFKGERKSKAYKIIPWAKEKKWKDSESMCKNRWVKITKGSKAAYAQWEDVGPFQDNNSAYVFGDSAPRNDVNKSAGIDVSPAVNDYLGLKDIDKVNWQFVDESAVPEGPWKKIITRSNITWN